MALGAESLPGWRNQPQKTGHRPVDSERAGSGEDMDSPVEQPDDAAGSDRQDGSQLEKGPQTASTTTTGGGSNNEPVVVWQADNRLEAQIVKGRLESHGVPAFLSGEALGTIYGLTTGSLAATDVLVPGPLAQKARDILATPIDWDDAIWEDEAESAEEWDEAETWDGDEPRDSSDKPGGA